MGTVLVIDDDTDTLRLMLKIMRYFGYRALGAETGAAGLAILASEKPDMIIVDGIMPGMDGWEFIRLARANPLTAGIPIILNTGIDDGQKTGANEVWIKGQLGVEQIRHSVANHLKTSAERHGESGHATK